jgi:hypothetical protein
MRITTAALLLVMGLVFGCDGPSRGVGAPCIDDFDCRDRCLEDWPGGFCTLPCRDNRDCPPDSACIDSHGGVCMLLCRDSRECRNMLGSDDYECHGRRDTHRDRWDVCVPD